MLRNGDQHSLMQINDGKEQLLEPRSLIW